MLKINPPSSKSISNRYLILAALEGNNTKIDNVADCDDTYYMIKALKNIGLKIEQKNSSIFVKNSIFDIKPKNKTIQVYTDMAGTTTRFFTALACLTGQKIEIDGCQRMQERPLKELIEALESLGANIEHHKYHLPLKISESELNGTKLSMPGDISSQFLSAILLISPYIQGETEIQISKKLCSIPYIDLTIQTLKDFNKKIKNKNYKSFLTHNQKKSSKKIKVSVEADASSASYIGAYAALHPDQKILIKNIFKNSLQGDIVFLDHLKNMGCKTSENKEGTIVEGPKKLKSLGTVDMNQCPDLVMTFAVLAMFTEGKTKITNISNLRVKETDRLKALENEISKFKVKVKTDKDFIEIHGNPKLLQEKQSILSYPSLINTYRDHRIAMCFGILMPFFPQIKIENPQCVTKSYPNFWADLNHLIDNS